MMQKGKDVRVSTHHPNLENYADDRNEPWLFDNVSIEFIVPNSEEDKEKLRARVYQNASGTIQPFDVTVYQYDSTLIKVTDLITIFKAIIVFLNGGDYSDPFVNDPKKAAKVIPRTAKIKPYRGKTKIENRGFDDQHLQNIAEQCMKGIIEINHNRNMNKKLIRLTESDLHRIVRESVNKVLREAEGYNWKKYENNPERTKRDDNEKSWDEFNLKPWRKHFPSSRPDASLNDLYDGCDYYQMDTDRVRFTPEVDANLNVYDYEGVPALLDQSDKTKKLPYDDSEMPLSKIGKGFRNTVRETYRETFGKEIPNNKRY